MAGGINRAGDKIQKVADKIDALKKSFESTFSEEVVAKFSSSAEQLEKVLKEVEKHGMVEALSNFCDRLDDETISNLSETSKALLKALKNADEQKTIEEFTKTLKNLNSLTDWFAQNDKLKTLAQYSLYAGMAYAILSPVIGAMQGVRQTRSAEEFRSEVLQKLNILTANALQQSRLQAGMILQLNLLLEGKQLDEAMRAQLDSLSEESKNILKYTPTIDARALQTLTNQFINAFYIDVGMNLLDGIGENHPADSAIDAVIWDRMRTSWPAHDSTKITYAWIVQNYEAEKINKLMKEIAGLFSENGGNDFYYDKLVYENGFRERVFSKLIKDVLAHRKGMPNVQLCQYGQRILAVWQLAENKIDASFEEALAQDIKKTIINRALLEYCKDTAIYFRDVYNTKAELQSGAYNGFQNILHPIETATSLMKGLGLAGTPQEQRETQIRMLEHVAAHPTGVTTEICVTTAPVTGPLTWYFGPSVVRSIGYGVGALAIGAHLAANVMRNNRP